MARTAVVEVSDYERKRQETIAKNKALLHQLQLDAAQVGFAPKQRSTSITATSHSKSKTRVKAEPRAKDFAIPTRCSSRLKGIVADSEVAKRKAEEEHEAVQAVERAKRQRVSGALKLEDILVSGKDWIGLGNSIRTKDSQYGSTGVSLQETNNGATSKELRHLREKFGNLQLWQDVEPSKIKITPERIYAMICHPNQEKAVIFAGDKLGNLGIFDSSQSSAGQPSAAEDEESEFENTDLHITTLKLHTRTISTFQVSPSDSNLLYSSSYDSSIRCLDLNKGVAVEAYAPQDLSADEPLSGVQVKSQAPQVLYFSMLDGRFGIHDTRSPSGSGGSDLFTLCEKKIGGFSIYSEQPHLLATASLDRTLKLWDLRKLGGRGENRAPLLVGQHESKLSVSHAAFNHTGQVATTSYDNTIKIHDFSSISDWKVGREADDADMLPSTVIPHNNQTGRWVTILRAQWQQYPSDGLQRFAIGNMNRCVDIYASTGEQLAKLSGDGITAVPAVACLHPSQDWVAAGTASGKLCLWMD